MLFYYLQTLYIRIFVNKNYKNNNTNYYVLEMDFSNSMFKNSFKYEILSQGEKMIIDDEIKISEREIEVKLNSRFEDTYVIFEDIIRMMIKYDHPNCLYNMKVFDDNNLIVSVGHNRVKYLERHTRKAFEKLMSYNIDLNSPFKIRVNVIKHT